STRAPLLAWRCSSSRRPLRPRMCRRGAPRASIPSWRCARTSAMRFRRAGRDFDLDKELRYHLDRLTPHYLAPGLTEAHARPRAALEFGGLDQIKDATRDVRTAAWVDRLMADVLHALRLFRRTPGFTAVAILTLALGIGANAVLFAIVKAAFFPALPVRDP